MTSKLIKGALQAGSKVAGRNKRLVAPMAVNFRNFGLFSSHGDDEKEKAAAHEDLREAVRELSQGMARPTTSSSTSTLQEMNASPLQDLEVDQLEELARAHYEGEIGSSEASMERAVAIWAEAAERGSAESQYSLAVCYREGNGTVKDARKAFKMMLDLANRKPSGYHLAHYAVAVMFFEKEGVDAALKEADREKHGFYHMKEAARKGVLPALYNIGNCYSAGRGVKQSDHNAQLYYSAAVEAGDPAAKFTLGTWLVQGRGGLPKDLERAFSLQIEAAQAGHLPAAFNAGCHLMTGQGCERDPAQAATWFEKAATGNIMQACVNLANMYREGLGVPKDLIKARNLVARFAAVDASCQKLMFALEAEIAAEG
jgi:TPR repeat protein